MVAYTPQILTSQLVYNVAVKFQRLNLGFLIEAIQCVMHDKSEI